MGKRLQNGQVMSTKYIRKILKFMRVIYGHYRVYLLGGEPTLHPELDKVLKICKEEKYLVVLTSNGLISQNTWDKVLPRYIDSLSFSLDGASRESHEFLRGENTFQPLIENIKEARKRKFKIRLICTINKKNIREVPRIIKLASDLHVGLLSFHYFTPTGGGSHYSNLQLSNKEWLKFVRDLKDCVSKIQINDKLKIYYPPALVSKEELLLIEKAGYKGCPARNLERLSIFPDGKCYVCSAFLDQNVNFGQINNRGFFIKKDNDNELDIINKISLKCGECSYAYICKGGCAAYDYFRYGVPTNKCSGGLIPICPLWTMSVNDKTQAVLR
ncbi:MAG: radical SAM protein [Candidatus Pacebacteria bacterium]|nr:radical SAM protein [Candidatus Paceibacterota bacterium]